MTSLKVLAALLFLGAIVVDARLGDQFPTPSSDPRGDPSTKAAASRRLWGGPTTVYARPTPAPAPRPTTGCTATHRPDGVHIQCGRTEAVVSHGERGPRGYTGNRGSNGQAGRDGTDGSRGPAGPPGAPGRDSTSGKETAARVAQVEKLVSRVLEENAALRTKVASLLAALGMDNEQGLAVNPLPEWTLHEEKGFCVGPTTDATQEYTLEKCKAKCVAGSCSGVNYNPDLGLCYTCAVGSSCADPDTWCDWAGWEVHEQPLPEWTLHEKKGFCVDATTDATQGYTLEECKAKCVADSCSGVNYHPDLGRCYTCAAGSSCADPDTWCDWAGWEVHEQP